MEASELFMLSFELFKVYFLEKEMIHFGYRHVLSGSAHIKFDF